MPPSYTDMFGMSNRHQALLLAYRQTIDASLYDVEAGARTPRLLSRQSYLQYSVIGNACLVIGGDRYEAGDCISQGLRV